MCKDKVLFNKIKQISPKMLSNFIQEKIVR